MMHNRYPTKNRSKHQEDTSDILTQLRAGDRVTCEQWVKTHYEKIYYYHIRLTRNLQTAEDLTQDTFRSAWKALPSFEGNASFDTWLHRIAYNIFVSWTRRKGSRQCPREDLMYHEQTLRYQQEKSPLTRLMTKERAAQLDEKLWTLDEVSRQVLVLHYMQDLSYREMAMVMDQPTGTIKWRTSQALKKLRDCFKKEMIDETVQR